jgi:hypothetical protein
MGLTEDKEKPRFRGWWWIDAICIIQKEEHDVYGEKDIQLNMMRQIYSSANEVFAWLGLPKDQDMGYGMYYIARTKSLYAAVHDGDDSDQISSTKKRFRAMQLHIDSVFRAPYWGRLWILQELAVSERTTLACGMYEVSWLHLVNFATHVAAVRDIDPTSHIITRQYVWLLSQIYQNQPARLDLATLIYLSEHANCGKPKDRIIALLGLLRGGPYQLPVLKHPKYPCETFYWAVCVMLQDLDRSSKSIQKQCWDLTHQTHLEPRDECDRECTNLAICRQMARTMLGPDPVVYTNTFEETGVTWYFYRDRMVPDKSRSRSRSRSASTRRNKSTKNKRNSRNQEGSERYSRSRSRSRSASTRSKKSTKSKKNSKNQEGSERKSRSRSRSQRRR